MSEYVDWYAVLNILGVGHKIGRMTATSSLPKGIHVIEALLGPSLRLINTMATSINFYRLAATRLLGLPKGSIQYHSRMDLISIQPQPTIDVRRMPRAW